MPNYLMRCHSCKVILVYLILMMVTDISSSEENLKSKEIFVAKRNFLSREKDYLKTKPLSNDLRSFIKRYKRRPLGVSRKVKREDEDLKEHVFIVKNGNIEKLENLSDVTADVPSSDPSGLGNFTVIPLIIPITVKTFTNATFGDNITPYTDEDFSSTQAIRRVTDYDEDYTMISTKRKRTEKIDTAASSKSSSNVETKATTVSHSTPEEVVVDDSISTSRNLMFLNKVLSDVQDLISYEKDGKSSGSTEGAMCTVVGDWDSKIGGMQLQITSSNTSSCRPAVQVVPQEPVAESGFLTTGNWTITSLLPFNHSSLIMLTAISEKTVASFLGDCRICQGTETITGNWMLMVKSANCRDRQDAHASFSDVMRKSNIRKLHDKHLEEMSTMNLNTTTES